MGALQKNNEVISRNNEAEGESLPLYYCKPYKKCYNKGREILDVWKRQLSPLSIEYRRKGWLAEAGFFSLYGQVVIYIAK